MSYVTVGYLLTLCVCVWPSRDRFGALMTPYDTNGFVEVLNSRPIRRLMKPVA